MVVDVVVQNPQKSNEYEYGKTHARRDSKMCCRCCYRFCCGAPTTDERIHAPVLHDASQIAYCRCWGRASLPPITSNVLFTRGVLYRHFSPLTVLSMPSALYFTFSPRHALLLTQPMCVCPILVHRRALLIPHIMANLSCRSVLTHYTAANMLVSLCSTTYSSNVYGDIPVQYSQLEL